MHTSANSEDPDEMLHYVAFHQGLLCLLTKSTFRERNTIYLEILTCDPSIYIYNGPSQAYCIKPGGRIH